MRTFLRDALGSQVPDHLGLAYSGRWAPVDRAKGKVPDDQRGPWLRRLAEATVPPDYQHAYERWRRSLERDGSRAVEVALLTRLLPGHGNSSPTEVGLTVHHTWGVPIIPGSALKGLLNHYVDAVYGPDPERHDPEDAARAQRFRGVTYEGRRIVRGPGEIHRALFGAPALDRDGQDDEDPEGRRGEVIFQDAWYIPAGQGDRPYAEDVLTVHQKRYYDSQGRQGGPNDHDAPTPISFLTVRPEAQFLLALSGEREWTALAFDLLRDALIEWGVGGKTAAGYGRIQPESWRRIIGFGAEKTAESSVLAAFLGWLGAERGPQRERLRVIREEWLGPLRALPAGDKKQAAAQLRKALNSPRLAADLERLLSEMNASS